MTLEPILIVDDNPANLKFARVLLSSEGYYVRTAVTAEDAIKVLKTYKPRLIIMDIQLPGLDGLEFTRRLKADPSRREIIVLALTAYAMKGDAEKAFAAGCNGYISKPIDPDTFPSIVGSYLNASNVK